MIHPYPPGLVLPLFAQRKKDNPFTTNNNYDIITVMGGMTYEVKSVRIHQGIDIRASDGGILDRGAGEDVQSGDSVEGLGVHRDL